MKNQSQAKQLLPLCDGCLHDGTNPFSGILKVLLQLLEQQITLQLCEC